MKKAKAIRKKTKNMRKKNEDGRSMIEMFGVLSIVGVLSVGSLSGYEYAYASYQAGQIRDTLLTAKKSAGMTTSTAHAKEIRRLLGEHLSKYGLTSNSTLSGFNRHYKVELAKVPPRICTHLWEMKNVLSSFSIEMTTPADKNACKLNNPQVDTVPMAFEFNALDNQTSSFESGTPATGCTNDTDCGGGGYCQGGDCVECRSSNDCSGNQVCDWSTGQCTDDCSQGACKNGLHCINNQCGECEGSTEWNSSSKSCECPSGTYRSGNDCVPLPETTTPYIPEVTEPVTSSTPEITSPTTASTTTTPPETTTTSKCNGGGTTMLDNEEVCWCGGWGGENCTYTDLAEPCHYRGLWCGPGCICYVPGWGGRDCSIPMSSFCNNHGVIGVGWKNHSSWVSNTCYCNNGWSGANCETCTGSDNECKCNGHGSWDNNNSRCVCNEPWCGTDCSQVSSNYCGEHGTWWISWEERCQCRPGWYGTYCDKCSGHGAGYNSSTEICTSCQSGWGGNDCSQIRSNCNNHGYWYNITDEKGYCSCTDGYGGMNCETANATHNLCHDHGYWNSATGKCTCNSGFTGDNCDKEDAIKDF